MARLVTIEVSAASGSYEAAITRMRQQNAQLYGDAQAGAAQTAGAMKMWETSLQGIMGLVSQLGIGLSAMAAINWVDKFTSFAEQLKHISERTKISVEDLNALERIAKVNETTFDDLSSALTFLQRSLAQAADPTSQQAKLLKALGVSSREPLEAFMQLSDAFKNNLDENNRLLAARTLLGRSSQEMVNMMNQGGDALRNQIAAEKESGVITTDFAKRVDEARDNWQNFKDVMSVKIGVPVIEGLFAIGNALKWINDNLPPPPVSLEKIIDLAERVQNSPGFRLLMGQPIYGGAAKAKDPWADLNEKAKGWAEVTSQLGKKVDVGAVTGTGSEKAAEILNKQSEALDKTRDEILKTQLAMAEFARQNGDTTAPVLQLQIAMIEQEYAAKRLALAHDTLLTPALANLMDVQKQLRIEQVTAAEKQRTLNEYVAQAKIELDAEAEAAKNAGEAMDYYAKFLATVNAQEINRIETDKQIADLQADNLTMLGKTTEAEQMRLQNQINYLRTLRDTEQQTLYGPDAEAKLNLRNQQIANAESALAHFGAVTLDVGKHIGDTLNTIFTAMIAGTLKSVDVGKTLLSTLGNMVTDVFQQTIKNKLSFELDLFNNLRGLPGQANQAMLSGGGGGGIFQTLLFGTGAGGISTAGGIGPLLENGQFFSGTGGAGGGGGGIFGSLMNIVGSFTKGGGTSLFSPTNIVSSLINMLPTSLVGGMFGFGSAGAGVIGPTLANGGFFSTLSGAISSAVVDAIGTVSTSAAATASSLLTSISSFTSYIPYVGAIIAAVTAIYRIIANQQERPNVRESGVFGGVAYNAATEQFEPGSISFTIGRKVDIKNKQAGQIADIMTQTVGALADQWVAILNIFPDTLSDQIIPALTTTNERLAANFRNLKFSPGGSRSIQQELEAYGPGGVEGQLRFLDAFIAPLGAAFTAALAAANMGDINRQQLTYLGPGFGSITPPTTTEDFKKLMDALINVAQQTSAISTAGPLLTPQDRESIKSIFNQLFSTSDPTAFVQMSDALKDQLKSVMDYINSSMQQSADTFGQAMSAALNSLDTTTGWANFLNVLNTGVEKMVFDGIVQAFLATQEFNQLLAPLQETIREYTSKALTSGLTPEDVAAFNATLNAEIADFMSKESAMKPLIDALSNIGATIKGQLNLTPPPAPQPTETPAPAPIIPANVTIYINGAQDPEAVAREIDALLRGQLAPA